MMGPSLVIETNHPNLLLMRKEKNFPFSLVFYLKSTLESKKEIINDFSQVIPSELAPSLIQKLFTRNFLPLLLF